MTQGAQYNTDCFLTFVTFKRNASAHKINFYPQLV